MKKTMRYNLNKSPLVALTACLALVAHVSAQSASNDFQLDQPMPVTNQDGQKVLLVGMQGSSVIFEFPNMRDARASIPVEAGSRIRFSYPYPQNFSDIQLNILNGNYDRALRLIRTPPVDLLHFLSVPEPNCNFHLY